MALQFILGASGAGKSHYLYNRIIKQSQEELNTRFLVIVPEQFTMETQKDFIKMHPNHGIMNIDVLSFMRLSYRIMEETGRGKLTVLEDIGKNMVLRRVLMENAEKLHYFRSNIKKQGFVDEIKSLLSELYQYNIGLDELEDMIKQAEQKPMLKAKLMDIRLIFEKFKEFIEERYITAEETMDVLYDALCDSKLIKDSVLCFDGFTGFTPSQLKVMSRLIKDAKMVYITVTMDEREAIHNLGEPFQLFYMSKKMIHQLEKLALQEKVELCNPVYVSKLDEVGTPWRFRANKELAVLEHNLYRYPSEVYKDETEKIHLLEVKTIKDEVRFVIQKIHHLVREKGYRYRDFALVTGDLEDYKTIIEKELQKAEIPFFLDDKRDISGNPYVIFLFGMIQTLYSNFEYENLFYFLRCGMLPFTNEEIDKLENYCIAMGIRGRARWREEFVRKPQDMAEEELVEINMLRERIIMLLEPIIHLTGKGKHTVKEYIEALYELTVSVNIYEQLSEYEQQFEESGDLLRAKEYGQVYKTIMELFDSMMELLGEEKMTALEWKEIVSAGIAKAKVGVIPAGIDQMMVGDIERSRIKDIRVLFLLGVNDGILPKDANSGGILSDREREYIKSCEIELAPTAREKIYTERFYLYLNLTKPSEDLYIIWHQIDSEGKAIKPSYLVSTIQRLFPKVKSEKVTSEWEQIEALFEGDGGWDYLLQGLREFEGLEETEHIFRKIYSWYRSDSEKNEQLEQLLKNAYGKEANNRLSRAVANALYGKRMTGSITRLEQYAACACAHYLSYGLRLQDRKEFKLNAPDLGNVFHAALELFSKKMAKKGLTWQTISDEERIALGNECVREVTEDYGNTIFNSSSRNQYMIKRISRILNRTLWALAKQLGGGDFEPSGYELRFSFMDDLESTHLPLEQGGEMVLTGRIDRVDTCIDTENDEIYVKVIDYKTGKHSFLIQDVYYGLELQLVVYMQTMLEQMNRNNPKKNAVPAGIFYYNIDDPIVELANEEEREEKLLKELKVNGLVNSEARVISSLDHVFRSEEADKLAGMAKSLIIPADTLKSGEFSKYSSVAGKEDFESLIQYTRKKMIQFGNEIQDGNCEKNPYTKEKQTACDYCSFQGTCGFDRKLEEYSFRKLKKLDSKEALEKIKESFEEKEECLEAKESLEIKDSLETKEENLEKKEESLGKEAVQNGME